MKIKFYLLTAMIGATSASSSNGAIMASNASNALINFFSPNISGSDLINSGQATLGSATSTDTGTFPASGANDGLFSGNTNKSYWTDATNGADNVVTLTFTLAGSVTATTSRRSTRSMVGPPAAIGLPIRNTIFSLRRFLNPPTRCCIH